LFHINFQTDFRQSFSLPIPLRLSYSWQALQQIEASFDGTLTGALAGLALGVSYKLIQARVSLQGYRMPDVAVRA
jgi:hypothetical protein